MKLSDLINKDDIALFDVCLTVLGKREFKRIKSLALNAAAESARDAPDIKKANLARRAINNVFISALRDRGVTNWRIYIKQKEF